MTLEEERQLRLKAAKVRLDILDEVYSAKSGHPGGSLSAADVLTYLYEKELNVDPSNPRWEDRDRFVLSKGHAAPALYAGLAEKGFFPVKDLTTLRRIGSYLQGHPNMRETPGVDMSTGSLGQGVSTACGMALGLKYQKKNARVYTLLGDGEIEEGEVWEAMMFAYPIDEKMKAFGLEVETIDGHDFGQIEAAMDRAKKTKGKAYCIILKTVKGKGVSFMENQVGWHGKAPNEEQYKAARKELEETLAKLEAEA